MRDDLDPEYLFRVFHRQGTDKIKYSHTYAREFSHIDPHVILEIGVSGGGGVRALREFFPGAVVYGIDCNPDCRRSEATFIGSQDDPDFLALVAAQTGPLDLVIDDGSHRWSHQRISFDALFPHLNQGGIYIIEDLETSYGDDYGDPQPFTEYLKEMVDTVCHEWCNPLNAWTMRLYPRVAVIEKNGPYADFASDWLMTDVLSVTIGGE